jgi:hypothetical protein
MVRLGVHEDLPGAGAALRSLNDHFNCDRLIEPVNRFDGGQVHAKLLQDFGLLPLFDIQIKYSKLEDQAVETLDGAGADLRADAAGGGEVIVSRLQHAIEQIVFARNYTIGLLDQTPPDEWFRQPPGGVSHVAWQVGHIAFSGYHSVLWRIRGERPDDSALFSPDFERLFGADSVPQAESPYPPAELRVMLDRVHEQVLRELPGIDEAELDQPVRYPHPFATTKLRALLWCAHHEMLHAGQIGLLRRHLGYPPMW